MIWDGGGQRHAAGVGYVSWPLPMAAPQVPVTGAESLGVTFLATAATTGLVIGVMRERVITAAVGRPSVSQAQGGPGLTWDDNGMRNAIVIGHISWPINPDGTTILASGMDVLGAAALHGGAGTEVSVGYSRRRTIIVNGDQYIRLDCIQCDLSKAHPISGTSKE